MILNMINKNKIGVSKNKENFPKDDGDLSKSQKLVATHHPNHHLLTLDTPPCNIVSIYKNPKSVK